MMMDAKLWIIFMCNTGKAKCCGQLHAHSLRFNIDQFSNPNEELA